MLIQDTKYLEPTYNFWIITGPSVSCSLDVRVLVSKVYTAAACPFRIAMKSVVNWSNKCCHWATAPSKCEIEVKKPLYVEVQSKITAMSFPEAEVLGMR